MNIRSAYVCVKDMERAISFYEDLLQMQVTEHDALYSVFELQGFRLGLYAYEKNNEPHTFGNNVLLSIEFASLHQLKECIIGRALPFPLTRIKNHWVCEIKDSEGNHLELTAPVE